MSQVIGYIIAIAIAVALALICRAMASQASIPAAFMIIQAMQLSSIR